MAGKVGGTPANQPPAELLYDNTMIQPRALLTDPLEPTNEARAKIAGIKLCKAYRGPSGAGAATAARRWAPDPAAPLRSSGMRAAHLVQAGRIFGLDGITLSRSIRGIGPYLRNQRAFRLQARTRSDFDFGRPFPCLSDRYDTSGVASGHYFHQDLYVAQAIHAAQPERHVDVGSRVDGFVAHVAAFREIEVFDIRPLGSSASNITFRQRDISQPALSIDNYSDSVSCLHTLEHIGLGRYGDPVAYDGYRQAWEQLHRMVKPGGTLYFSVPVGRHQRIEFDAHRVFSLPFLVKEMIGSLYDVAQFAYVDDDGELHTGVDLGAAGAAETFNLNYGCAIFTLIKRS